MSVWFIYSFYLACIWVSVAVFDLRSRFPPWFHLLRHWKLDTANTKTPIIIWSMLPTSHRPCTTCYSRLGWWWVDWTVLYTYLLKKKSHNPDTLSRTVWLKVETLCLIPTVYWFPFQCFFLFINKSNPFMEKGFARGRLWEHHIFLYGKTCS